MMNKHLIISVLLLSMSACSNNFKEAREDTRKVDRKINELASKRTAKVTTISKPPVRLTRVETFDQPEWLKNPTNINVDGLPLMMVLQQVVPADVDIWLDGDIDPNKPVKVSSVGTVADALNVIERNTNYGVKATKQRIEVRQFETETFIINLPVGMYSAQLGSQGEQASSESGGTVGAGAVPRVEGQYINVQYNQVDVFTDIKTALRILLTKDSEENTGAGTEKEIEGDIEVATSLGAITVRTTPARMVNVRQSIERFQDELSRQVLLDITVLEFRSNFGQEQGVDWDLLRRTGGGSLQFFIPGTTTVSGSAGYGLAFSGINKWDGTQAFIRALKQQGNVSTETPISALLLNNQPGRISQTLKMPYADEVKTQANENVITASVTRANAVEGVDMMMTPKVQNDYVWLRISGKLSKVVAETEKTIFDTALQFKDTRESEINFSNKLRYGQSIVIASVKQSSTTSEETRSWFSGGKGTQREVVETLVLLTPRRVQ